MSTSAGLQIFDANGNVILDGTYRCGRLLGFVQLVPGQAGSFGDARFSQGSMWYAVQRDRTFHLTSGFGSICQPNFSFASTVLSWTYAPMNNAQFDEYAGGYLLAGVF